LESSAALGTPSTWTPVPGPPALVQGRLVISNAALLPPRFFRLAP
jgi:hypothetical protein